MVRARSLLVVAFTVGCGSHVLNVGADDGGTQDHGPDAQGSVGNPSEGGAGDEQGGTPPGSADGSAPVAVRCPNWRLVPGPYQPNGFQSQPQTTAMVDLNGDGKVDLVVGDLDDFAVLLGDGDGRVDAPVTYGGTGQGLPAIGDVNGDGKLDVVTSLAVLLGNGDGTFQPSFATGAYVYDRPQLVDMNGDGKLDIVSENGGGAVLVALGNGDGTFQPPRSTPAASSVVGVTVGDFNKDGKLDVAAIDISAGAVDVLLGWGDGNLQPPFAYMVSSSPATVATTDLDGDGSPDLVITDNAISAGGSSGTATAGGGVGMLYGRVDGSFGNWRLFASSTGTPTAAAIGDMNEDGVPDVVVAQGKANMVSVLMSMGRGNYSWVAGHVTGSGPSSVALGDLNGDGHLDVALANPSSNSVTILLSMCGN